MEYLSKFSGRLNDLMAEHELNAPALAEKVGFTSSAIRNWIRGDRLPTLESLIVLADFFHCSLDYLIGKSDLDKEVISKEIPAFYPRLRQIMNEYHISRYNIVHHTAIRDSYFANWAKGEMPSLPLLCELSNYLKISIDYLVGRTEY